MLQGIMHIPEFKLLLLWEHNIHASTTSLAEVYVAKL